MQRKLDRKQYLKSWQVDWPSNASEWYIPLPTVLLILYFVKVNWKPSMCWTLSLTSTQKEQIVFTAVISLQSLLLSIPWKLNLVLQCSCHTKTRDQHFLTHVYIHGSRISHLQVTRHVTTRSPESLLPFCFLQRKLLANVHHHSVWHALLNACSVTETTGWASLSLIIFTQAPVTYTKLRENETYSQADDSKLLRFSPSSSDTTL